MTFAQSPDIGPGQASPHSTAIIRWMPTFMRAVAVAVTVVAMATMVGWPETRTPQADKITSQPNPSSGPVFDGRGKWGGYAR